MFIEAIRRAAQIAPARPATVFGARTRSWAEHVERTARLGGLLQAMGAKRGDRIGILANNGDHFLEAIHAIWWIGAVVVPMNVRWALPEHIDSVLDARIAIVFSDGAHAEMARAIAAGAGARLLHLEAAEDEEAMTAVEAHIAASPRLDPVRVPADDLAGVFFTGGTTGRPKGVMHSARTLWSAAMTSSFDMRIPDAVRYLHAPPMFHLGGLTPAFATTVLAGTHVFLPQFRPELVFEATRTHKVQYMALVPTMVAMLVDDPMFSPEDFRSLEVVLYGGGATSPRLHQALNEGLPWVRFQQGFGQTEVGGSISTLAHEVRAALPKDHPRRRSAGRVSYGCEIQVVDPAGNPLEAGGVGELCVRSPGAMLGYFNRPEETAQALRDGWVHTGDAGYLDEVGYIYVCDRLKDVVRTGGENVFSAEVENVLALHPAVQAVAIVAAPDERWDERVHAIVAPRAGAAVSLEDLQAFCRPRIAGYKIPRSLQVVDSLPLSPQGKVLKSRLRDPLWAGRTRV